MRIFPAIIVALACLSCSRDTPEYVWTSDQVWDRVQPGWPDGWCPVETTVSNKFWVRTLDGKNIKPPK